MRHARLIRQAAVTTMPDAYNAGLFHALKIIEKYFKKSWGNAWICQRVYVIFVLSITQKK